MDQASQPQQSSDLTPPYSDSVPAPAQPTAPVPQEYARPYALPLNSLNGRFYALGRSARLSLGGLSLYGVPGGMFLGQMLAVLPVFFWGVSALPQSSSSMSSSLTLPLVMFGLMLLGWAAGGLGAYFLMRAVLQSNYRRAYDHTQRELQSTELPLLVADEAYCASLLEKVRDQVKFLFCAPPSSKRLEDQLGIAAAYIVALRQQEFRLDAKRSPALRRGDRGYYTTTAGARTLNLIGGVGFCLPYLGCLSFIFLPFLILNLLRLAEQKGALAAIADYFAEAGGLNAG